MRTPFPLFSLTLPSLRTLQHTLLVCFAYLMLNACAAIPRHIAVPEKSTSQATVKGFPSTIRFWADEAPADFAEMVAKRAEAYRTMHLDYYKEHGSYPPISYLAISGGAYDGAFGAGLLCGWSDSGKRPDFSLVTGVSTGALIAPFVYVGKQYDPLLHKVYTSTKSDNIFVTSVWKLMDGLTGGLALIDSSPLEHSINTTITPQLVKEMAEQNRRGKKLYIATTNMEAQRGVIWDIGEIAASGNKRSIDLIHDIMLASASVPGIFRPVFINVEVNGSSYTEIHADGGVTSQVFAYPLKINRAVIDEIKQNGFERNLYIIRNSKITPEYHTMDPWVLSMSHRSLESLIKYQGLGDLYRLYVATKRDGVNYHLATIPADFKADSHELFDTGYMQKLFQVGYEMGKSGNEWLGAPPGVEYVTK
jgi:predicted acylesterase/phospholipase RssA